MIRHAKDGRHLPCLIREAITICRSAQEELPPRTGPGRPAAYPLWLFAVLIFVAMACRRKSKCSQYRFLDQHRELLLRELHVSRLPCRSTYMMRYGQCQPLYRQAIKLQGRRALGERISSAQTVATDKSLVPAVGPCWPKLAQREGRRPCGVDDQAAWGYSPHDGWVWGYSYEVVVCATPNCVVFPLLASAERANSSEQRTFLTKIPELPRSVRNVVVDSGYDSNEAGERIEYTRRGRPTGRHFLCPMQMRRGPFAVGREVRRGTREYRRRHRLLRERFYHSRRGRRIYAQRGRCVEPFNQWLKQTFDLEHHVWHRGADNNCTLLLSVIFCYQLLLRYSTSCGHRDGQIQWLLDAL